MTDISNNFVMVDPGITDDSQEVSALAIDPQQPSVSAIPLLNRSILSSNTNSLLAVGSNSNLNRPNLSERSESVQILVPLESALSTVPRFYDSDSYHQAIASIQQNTSLFSTGPLVQVNDSPANTFMDILKEVPESDENDGDPTTPKALHFGSKRRIKFGDSNEAQNDLPHSAEELQTSDPSREENSDRTMVTSSSDANITTAAVVLHETQSVPVLSPTRTSGVSGTLKFKPKVSKRSMLSQPIVPQEDDKHKIKHQSLDILNKTLAEVPSFSASKKSLTARDPQGDATKNDHPSSVDALLNKEKPPRLMIPSEKGSFRRIRSTGDLQRLRIHADLVTSSTNLTAHHTKNDTPPTATDKSPSSIVPHDSPSYISPASIEEDSDDSEFALKTITVDRERSAITIQRFYRLYRMRVHFSNLINQVITNSSTSLGHKVEPTPPPPSAYPHSDKVEETAWSTLQTPKNRYHLVGDAGSQGTSLNSLPEHARSNAVSVNGSHQKLDELDTKTYKAPITPSALNSTPNSILSPTEKLLRKCINEFNINAEKGIANMIKTNVLGAHSESIAHFLFTEGRLSKTKIGEYLGSGDELPIHVLRAFVNKLNFEGLAFDEALRKLLQTFRLPGEAQKIDRVMNEFAKRYCQNNSHIFSSPDTGYVLAYSLIMLNTDAHNPNVKKKMSLSDFLRNNRGIDNKNDLPEDFMRQLYNNIVTREIKMNDCDNVFKIRELLSQITNLPDKPDDLALPQRRLVKEFKAQQVPDPSKPNSHRHDRIVFLFNDLIMITKPTSNTTAQAPTNVGPRERDLLSSPSSAANNAHHTNMVDLTNANGPLVTISFHNSDEKHHFMRLLLEFIEEVADSENDKRLKLQMLVSNRVAATKELIEKAYMGCQSNNNNSTSDPAAMSRFVKYGSLRQARLALQDQSSLMFGKSKLKFKQVKTEGTVDFRTKVELVLPSPSPHPVQTLNQTPIDTESHGSEIQPPLRFNSSEQDADHLMQTPDLSTNKDHSNRVLADLQPGKVKKRRHTIVGGSSVNGRTKSR